ncbi:sensor histidine kinase [Streptomyces sp. NBC_00582]|uniref:sensor histidine kinase n=1 Tax=Streptomyces sp. NBC_00582 TaxID=2975783 RepID=UPI002E808879|nr:HAMP domain-containing sensor histidine kinase [Streptomyces sp. NBC_00582]WUB59481.1 HAMP domain-containing histidine kinase [Streptomyces sp. NBC_00582]
MSTAACAAPRRRKGRDARVRPAPKSAVRRLTWGFLVIAALSVLGADLYCASALAHRLRERTDEQITQSHRFRLEALRAGRGLSPAQDGSASLVTDGRGAVRLSTGPATLLDSLPESAKQLRERAGTDHPLPVEGRAARAIVDRLPDGAYLVTARSTSADAATVRTLVGIETVTGVPLIVVLSLAVLWGSRRAFVSVREMSCDARRIAEGRAEPSEGVPVVTHPLRELRSAADTYNYLLRRIEEDSVRRRREEHWLCELVDAASHELRTPLTTITGYTQLALIRALDDPNRRDQAMEQVQKESQRLSGLVEDMLLLARLGLGGVLDQRPVDLAQLCHQAVTRAQTPGTPRTLRCVVESFPHWVKGDLLTLQRAIDNLLSNVLAHTPEETSAQVRLGLDGDRHVIDVIDDGPGVAESVRDRIFEPFFRAASATPKDPQVPPRPGRGLGLSVAAAVVTAHGGSIGLEPSERGAWFRVSLPATGRGRLLDTASPGQRP